MRSMPFRREFIHSLEGRRDASMLEVLMPEFGFGALFVLECARVTRAPNVTEFEDREANNLILQYHIQLCNPKPFNRIMQLLHLLIHYSL